LTLYPIYGRIKNTERMATILKEIYREETFANILEPFCLRLIESTGEFRPHYKEDL
jgi:hypothetical protein